jgi:hypothetical protein
MSSPIGPRSPASALRMALRSLVRSFLKMMAGGWRFHATGEGGELVLPPVSRALLGCGVRVRGHIPRWCHCLVMDRSDLLEAKEIPAHPVTRFHALSIDPAGGVGLPPDLHVLAQLLGPDGAALVQQFAHLVEDERVALERGGMVGFPGATGRPRCLRPPRGAGDCRGGSRDPRWLR